MDLEDSYNRLKNNLSQTDKLKKFGRLAVICIAAVGTGFFLSEIIKEFDSNVAASANVERTKLSAFQITKPNLKYGFAIDTFQVQEATIKNNQFLADILLKHHVEYINIDKIAKETKDIFDVRNLRANKKYTILSKDSTQSADYFIYEPDVFKYVVFDLKNPAQTKIVEREITRKTRSASGVIETSLWNTMVDNGLSFELTSKMEDALAWSVDFYHIQKGDKFKAVFEELLIDDQVVGVGEVSAAYYKAGDTEFYAVYFENEKHRGFYDLEARPMKKNFLKSPVKYSRISSRFNLRRFHPVQKRIKPHLGTDYAAPRGTPIYAVANGTITKASFTRGNGNYVKIRHDKTYETQYLHMQKRAKGMVPGVKVKQGDVIGYVGSTGLATGPHVGFRFWKNGRQINHLRLNFPPPDPMPEADIPKFNIVRDEMKAQLDKIRFATSSMVVNDIDLNEDIIEDCDEVILEDNQNPDNDGASKDNP